ncbi:MAG: hypothetical protein ACR2MX_16860, partial [Cyclobacteriaceae bacterium]
MAIILRLIRLPTTVIILYFLLYAEPTTKVMSMLTFGLIIALAYGLIRLAMYLNHRKKRIVVGLNTTSLQRSALLKFIVLGILVVVNYYFNFINLPDRILNFTLVIGLFIIAESINRFWLQILINDDFVYSLHKEKKIHWDKISDYKIDGNRFQITDSYRKIDIPFDLIDLRLREKVIRFINDNLSQKLSGSLTFDNDTL